MEKTRAVSEKCIARVAVAAASYRADRLYDYLIPEQLAGKVEPGMRVVVPFSAGNSRREAVVLATTERSGLSKLKCVESVLDERPVLTEEQLRLAVWMRERFFCLVYDAVRAMLPAGLWYSSEVKYRLREGVDRELAYAAAGRSKKCEAVLNVVFANGGECDVRDVEAAFGDADPHSALSSLIKKGVLSSENHTARRVRDKTVSVARLAISGEEAAEAAEAASRRGARQQAAVLQLLCAVGKASNADIHAFTGASPATLKRLAEQEFIVLEAEEVFRRPRMAEAAHEPLPELTESQRAAYSGILALTDGSEARAALLFGVTGSGKTTVYIWLIRAMLERGRGAILLVPEIALTPQMLRTFSSHFGDEIAVLHSSLAAGERYDEWKRVKSGAARVVIGTRSAVFAPVRELGIIIMDEEQEDTYKSENAPRYHARDVAKYRCAQSGALLLLGSATPDVCSRYAAEAGRYAFFTLPGRYNEMELPAVRIADMKKELRAGNGGNISSVLRDELEKNIAAGEQSILFINRRGASKLITCVECGFTYECPRCSVSLTWHSAGKRLMCHYCGFSKRLDAVCPECGGRLSFTGAGTQKVEQELSELFPGVEILRMDTDTVAPAGGHEALLSRFREKNIPIMVGTQMVTKGLNFENVTLVGVISADQSLYAGDYRASERTFSLITQVVGRGGRGARPGRAVIQTFTPGNQVITQAASQDYAGFYSSEIELRRIQNSPPFAELLTVTATGMDETAVLACCADVRDILLEKLKGREDARVLGPAPLPVVKVNDRYRYRVTLACRADRETRRLVSDIVVYCNTDKKYRGLSVFADSDPVD